MALISTVGTALTLASVMVFQWQSGGSLGYSAAEAADGDLRIFPQQLIVDEGCDSTASLSAQALLSAAAHPGQETRSFDAPGELAASVSGERASEFELNARIQNELQTQSRVSIQNLPLDAVHTVDLELERFTVFDQRSEIIIQDGTEPSSIPPADVALYRGHVHGDPESRVFLGVGNGIVNGFVSYAGATFSISSGPPQQHVRGSSIQCAVGAMSSDQPADDLAMACGTEWQDFIDDPAWAAGASDTDPAPALRLCKMAVVCDYDFYQRTGSDVTATATYIAQLFGAVSVIFERDFGITLGVRLIEVWTTSKDPFSACGISGLDEFREYANLNLFDRDWNLAYKASGCGGGGKAYADGICLNGQSLRGNNPFSTSALLGHFPTPIAPNEDNYDLYLVAHEITHNFSIGHTHCYDPPLDSCKNDESSCYTGEIICSRGTIMSYCHGCGGMSNIDLRFHPYIIDIVRSRLEKSCLPATSPGFYTGNAGDQTLYVDSIVSTASWLSASRDAFLISAGDTTAVYAVIDWSQIREQTRTASLLVYSSDDLLASPYAVDVTAIRHRPYADYEASVTEGCWPLEVAFQDQSSNGPTDWLWRFGDGDSSSVQSPVHTFSRPGTFTATLTALNDCGAHLSDRRTTIHITEPDLCCTLSTFIVPKNVVVLEALDLWSCGLPIPDDQRDVHYVIVGDPDDGAGAGVSRNRYLNFFPSSGWYGMTDFAIQAVTPDNCRCQTPVRVIINDPPDITLLDPPPGIQVVNRPYLFRWRDSDGNNNAGIDLYYTDASDCSGGVKMNEEPILEDRSESGGSYTWSVYGLPDGYYRLRAVISDPYTQSESCSPGTILLDLTPPVTSATVTCLGVFRDDWCHGDIEVALAASDTLTGVEAQFFSINRGPWQQYTTPLTITNVGQTLVEFFSVDSAGNVEQPRTTVMPVQIDRLGPYILQFNSGNKLFRSGDYTVDTPEFSIVLGDEGVGVDPNTIVVTFTPGTADGPLEFTYADDNVSYNPDTRRVSVSTQDELVPGTQRVTLTVSDILGNEGSASAEFVVESGLAIRDVVNSPNPFQQDTYFTFTLTEEPTEVRIRIFDLSGALMKEILAGDAHAGYNEVYWDGHSENGLTLANGAYLYEIQAIGPGGTDKHLDKLAILR